MTENRKDRRVRAALLGLIVAVAFTSRLYMAISTPLVYDEYQWIALADSVDLRPSHFNLPLHGDQHPPGQVYWAALGTLTFGQNLLGYRAPSVILGTIAVVLVYFLGKLLSGPTSGLLAAFLLATNEYHIGISRLCTEKNYLTFALMGLLLFEYALRNPSTRRFLALGAAMGLGILTKQALVLWVPVFGFEILRRRETRSLWRHPAPWCAVLVLLLIVSPDLLWNVKASSFGDSSGSLGLAYQLSRLTLGAWSWGPFALYLRPLYFLGVESAISEYASMTSISGTIILMGTAASVYLFRTPLARFLQIVGFGSFLFFCIFTKPAGEFWWADLTILPFIVLTAAVLGKLSGAWNAIGVVVLGAMLVCSWNLVRTRDNYFPIEWGSPPKYVIQAYKNYQRSLVVTFRERDHLKLCTSGTFELPACDFYETSLNFYEKYLVSIESRGTVSGVQDEGWPQISLPMLPKEKAWVQTQLERFRGFLSKGGSPLSQTKTAERV